MPLSLETKIDLLVDALTEQARSNRALAESVAALAGAIATGAEPEDDTEIPSGYGGLAG